MKCSGLILGRIADASSDVLAARNLCHCYCVVGNTVSWPVCKFLTATLLLGFCHWISFAAPIAVSIVSRQDWVLPSRRISNLAPWQFSLIYSNPLAPLAGFLDLSQSCERPDYLQGEPRRFDTTPSKPSLQAWRNTMSMT